MTHTINTYDLAAQIMLKLIDLQHTPSDIVDLTFKITEEFESKFEEYKKGKSKEIAIDDNNK